MTDLEMTRLCAEAAGYTLTQASRLSAPQPSPEAVRACIGKKASFWYHPLHDDAQAMALVKNHGLHIIWQPMCPDTWKVDDTEKVAASPDLNRAIVECVAK